MEQPGIVLVTGATGGIGFQTARELATRGWQVVVSGRDLGRGNDAVQALRPEHGGLEVQLLVADLSTRAGVASLAQQFRERYDHLDVLINLVMMAAMYEYALRTSGTGVTVNVCYPGQASTAMTRSVTPGILPRMMRPTFPLFKLVRPDGGKSAAKASRSSVFLATSAEVSGVTGAYFDTNCARVEWPSAVLDDSVRKATWDAVQLIAHGTGAS